MTSLSKALDKKLQTLRITPNDSKTEASTETQNPVTGKDEEGVTRRHAQLNGGTQSEDTSKKVIKIQKRRNSMIDRRKSNLDSIEDEKGKESPTISYRDPSLHRAHIVSVKSYSNSID